LLNIFVKRIVEMLFGIVGLTYDAHFNQPNKNSLPFKKHMTKRQQ